MDIRAGWPATRRNGDRPESVADGSRVSWERWPDRGRSRDRSRDERAEAEMRQDGSKLHPHPANVKLSCKDPTGNVPAVDGSWVSVLEPGAALHGGGASRFSHCTQTRCRETPGDTSAVEGSLTAAASR